MDKIFGLDISLTGTGVCSCDASSPKFIIRHTGTIKTKPHKVVKGEKQFFTNQERHVVIFDELIFNQNLMCATFVGIEDYAFANSSTDLPEIQGILRFLLFANKLPWAVFATTTIKKFATGKGNMPKAMVPMHVRTRFAEAIMAYGQEISDDNVADAIAICALTHQFYRWLHGLPYYRELTKEEVRVLEKIKESNSLTLK